MRLAFDIVRPKDPQFRTIHPKLQEARFWPHFEDCIGAEATGFVGDDGGGACQAICRKRSRAGSQRAVSLS